MISDKVLKNLFTTKNLEFYFVIACVFISLLQSALSFLLNFGGVTISEPDPDFLKQKSGF